MKAASILVLATLLLSACNTFEGIGKDIKKGGEAIERAATK
ncbi:MAG: entericidin A/B family lipoprotein [Halothiobacillaceae bacterium]